MMNAQDAQGFMEDVAVIEAGRRAANDVAENGHAVTVAQHHTEMTKTIAAVGNAVALKVHGDKLASLRQDRNNQVIHASALQRTLDHVIRDFAKAAGVTEEALKARYNVVRTQHYNALANEGMASGWFSQDPRLAMQKAKEWYVPGLDADHGW